MNSADNPFAPEDDTPDGEFSSEMERFAQHLAAEAQKEGVKLSEKVKVFDALTAYLGIAKKGNKAPASGDAPEKPGKSTIASMSSIRRDIREAS